MVAKSKLVNSNVTQEPRKANTKPSVILLTFALAFILLALITSLDTAMLYLGIVITMLVVSHISIKLSAVLKSSSVITAKKINHHNPFVTIHIACKSEPASLVNKTVEAMTKLDYKNYEVIVINSNNTDKDNWSKIKKYVESRGKNYRFVHLDTVSGFKAGALNHLNNNYLSNKAEIIAIVDCDYIVTPDFLNKTVPYFNNPKIGIVQAPQCYYNVNSNNTGLFWEYRSFFAIVMHQAQRLNLVTFLGTMGLIRAELIKKGLSWNEWCITEDVEAGVYINSIGYSGVFVDECLGKGLMPYDYASLIKQRQRWTYGNMQIIKKDLVSVLTNSKAKLSLKRKFAFIAQLATWFHLDLIIALMYVFNNLIMLFGYSTSYTLFVNSLLLFLLIFSLIGNLFYFIVGLKNETNIKERVKAFLAHYGLLYIMSSSWVKCLLGQKLGFHVTHKEKTDNKIHLRQFYRELTIPILLVFGLVTSLISNRVITTDIYIVIIFIAIELIGIIYLQKSFVEPKEQK